MLPGILVMFVTVLLGMLVPMQVSAHITVLLYHKFDEIDSPSTSTPSGMFEQQMAYLKENDYAVLSMEQLQGCMEGRIPIPEKGVVITLDDGDLSEYTRAFPVLKRYGYPFCIFIYTRAPGAPGFMNWDQIREIRRHGGDVGSHTHTHPYLIDLSPHEIDQELTRSKKILESELGAEVRWFAYPFGQYDASCRDAAVKAGYTLIFTSDPGSVGAHTNREAIPRQAIVGQNMDMKRFVEKVNTPPLDIDGRIPDMGRLPGTSLPEITITIRNPELYFPDQVQVFLSEKGRLSARFDPEAGTLSCPGPIEITRKVNRIITTARRRSDRAFAMYSYMIVLPSGQSPGSDQ